MEPGKSKRGGENLKNLGGISFSFSFLLPLSLIVTDSGFTVYTTYKLHWYKLHGIKYNEMGMLF